MNSLVASSRVIFDSTIVAIGADLEMGKLPEAGKLPEVRKVPEVASASCLLAVVAIVQCNQGDPPILLRVSCKLRCCPSITV